MDKIDFGYSFQNRDIHPMGDKPSGQFDMFVELNNLDSPNKQKELDIFWDRVYSDPFSIQSYNELVYFHELANGTMSGEEVNTHKNNTQFKPNLGMNSHNMMMQQNKNMSDYSTRAHNPQLKSNHYKPYKG